MSGLSEDKFIRCFKFDQASNNLCVGTKDGSQLIDYSNPTDFSCAPRLFELKAYLLELIPETDVLIYVPDEARKTIIFYDYKKRQQLANPAPTQYTTPIVRIKAIRERILVALENALHIYSGFVFDFQPLRQIDLSGTISENVVDLCAHPINSYVAYPSFDRIGQLSIADCVIPTDPPTKPEKPKVIQAHDNALVAIAIDPYGRIVASASETGVLIKVNRIFNGECVYEFRRGVTLGITITSLSFSMDGRFLWTHDTSRHLKIYKFGYKVSVAIKGTYWFLETVQRLAESVLPENASNWFFQADPFASAELLESSACKSISTIYQNDKNNIPPHLLVANADGLVYTYLINYVDGGPCELLKSYCIEEEQYTELPKNSWVII